jgi:hypothetical protein
MKIELRQADGTVVLPAADFPDRPRVYDRIACRDAVYIVKDESALFTYVSPPGVRAVTWVTVLIVERVLKP